MEISVEMLALATPMAVSLINAVFKAIGWQFAKNDTHQQAVTYLVGEISKLPGLSPLEKAAMMTTASKAIREYSNQSSILKEAVHHLSEGAHPDKVDADWFSRFFEEAKHVSDKEIQKIWAKLLANECNNPRSVPKKLIHILSYMDQDLAKAFETLSSFCLRTYNQSEYFIPQALIAYSENKEFYKEKGLYYKLLCELESLGLIVFRAEGIQASTNHLKFSYFDVTFHVKSDSHIRIGNVNLTDAGIGLFDALVQHKDEVFLDFCYKYFRSKGYSIIL